MKPLDETICEEVYGKSSSRINWAMDLTNFKFQISNSELNYYIEKENLKNEILNNERKLIFAILEKMIRKKNCFLDNSVLSKKEYNAFFDNEIIIKKELD